jgi:spermidine synthase|tara:strand:- start:1211 stop:1396 length:186 start_codon:yes stop_codon:yes gene_type:complete
MLFNVYVGVSREDGIVVVQLKAKSHDQALEKVKRIFPKAKDYTLEVKVKDYLAEYYTEVLL